MLCADIRRLQQRSGCSDVVCMEILQLFKDYADTTVHGKSTPDTAFKHCDKKIQSAAGVQVMKLNGCTGCHKHVYTQDDKATLCPHCAHPRYNEAGKPNELVFYFPIKPKLQALMRLDAFKKMLEHENERPCNPNLMSDIYDSPAWREFMVPPAASSIDR